MHLNAPLCCYVLLPYVASLVFTSAAAANPKSGIKKGSQLIKPLQWLFNLCGSKQPIEDDSSIEFNNNDELNNSKWFKQKLDHFKHTDTRTWNQRYYVNQKYYKTGGPVLLMIGWDTALRSKIESEALLEYAERLNALYFFLEHRYYGKSRPTADLRTENLVYLSSEQALADIALFIFDIQSLPKYEIPPQTKWIVFGGSYAGTLAAWSRLKYPHLIHAAVSSSAPLMAKMNFDEYNTYIENMLGKECPLCMFQIDRSYEMIKDALNNNEILKIEDKLKLCSLDTNDKKNVDYLFWALTDILGLVMQYGNFHLKSLKNEILNTLVERPESTALDRYAIVIDLILRHANEKCLFVDYKMAIEPYKNIAWNDQSYFFPDHAGNRQWHYQKCTEFGFFQTRSGRNEWLNQIVFLEFFVDRCADIFGKQFNSTSLSKRVDRINELYGGLDNKVSRVIFVHGSHDPWKQLGITRTETIDNVAININGTSHCEDLTLSVNDIPDLYEARQTILNKLMEWLK